MKFFTLRNSTLVGIRALDAIPALLRNGTLPPSDEVWDAKDEALIRLDSPAFARLTSYHHHDSWARFYDHVYSQLPGFDAYTRLSPQLLLAHCPPPCTILDLGAGTGRLAILLAGRADNRVTAVEVSSGMIAVLMEKVRLAELQERVEVWQGVIQDFDSPPRYGKFQLVICLQTVLNYLLETADLERFADVVARHTMPGGHLVIDLAQREAMRDLTVDNGRIHRVVQVVPQDNDRFRISETCRGKMNGEPFDYRADDWTARYWQPEAVIRLLEARGFRATRVPDFDSIGIGSTVHVFQREGSV